MSSTQERVDALDQYEFNACAVGCATTLPLFGQGFASLSPGDATKYLISIVKPMTSEEFRRMEYRLQRGELARYEASAPYFVATSFGRMYPWDGQPVDTSYVQSKWVSTGSVTGRWTAAVIARFLNTLSPMLAKEEVTQ